MQTDFSNIFLITDLDHTLLTRNSEISCTDRNSIREFVAKGGHFAVATGRVHKSAMRYIRQLDVNMPCILYNGGIILDVEKDEVLWECALPSEAERYTCDIIKAFPDVGVEIIAGDSIYTPNLNEFMERKMQLENISCLPAAIEDIPIPWMKVLLTAEEETIQILVDFIRAGDYPGVSFVQSSTLYYEMLPIGSSKGNALQKMRGLLGLESMKIVAVGDYNNDIEMIKIADIGACVADSPDEVKRQADIILTKTSDENALTELINHIKNNLEV